MLPKGMGSIRGLHSINTRPGAQSRPDVLRRMYLLACEEEHLKNKTEWLKRQKEQTGRRLGEIWRALGFLKTTLEEKQKKIVKQGKGNPNFRKAKSSSAYFRPVSLKY